MAKLLSCLLFAAALMLGLGSGPSMTHACPMQSAQAETNSSPVQLAMEEADEGSAKAAYDEEEVDEEKSE
ncbi:MAG: hypothetical protein QNJ62_11790 [Methyloceanibacter sp.]|nr:hypothetical protein [Methyloceanibacter sp.]